MKNKFAAQLWTVRKQLEIDYPGILRELKKMGWSGVQINSTHGYSREEIAAVLKETGLRTAGLHVGLLRMKEQLNDVMEEAKLYGTRDLIVPSLPREYNNELGFIRLRNELNEIARIIAGQGFRLSYHNHAGELKTAVHGSTALEYILQPDRDNSVLAEIDVYWIKKGGSDPIQFIQPYANRMPIIHLKDMTDDEHQTTAEIGTGSIDFIPILQWGEQNGVEWYVVEQDECPGNPMDSLQLSFDNLNRLVESDGH